MIVEPLDLKVILHEILSYRDILPIIYQMDIVVNSLTIWELLTYSVDTYPTDISLSLFDKLIEENGLTCERKTKLITKSLHCHDKRLILKLFSEPTIDGPEISSCITTEHLYNCIETNSDMFSVLIDKININIKCAHTCLEKAIKANNINVVKIIMQRSVEISEELMHLAFDSIIHDSLILILLEHYKKFSVVTLNYALNKKVNNCILEKIIFELTDEVIENCADYEIYLVVKNVIYHHHLVVLSYLLSYSRIRNVISNDELLMEIALLPEYNLSTLLILKHCTIPKRNH